VSQNAAIMARHLKIVPFIKSIGSPNVTVRKTISDSTGAGGARRNLNETLSAPELLKKIDAPA
jgi:hypothetical protein